MYTLIVLNYFPIVTYSDDPAVVGLLVHWVPLEQNVGDVVLRVVHLASTSARGELKVRELFVDINKQY